jgi:hypothetical protein
MFWEGRRGGPVGGGTTVGDVYLSAGEMPVVGCQGKLIVWIRRSWRASARRHGVGDDDMLHAYHRPIRVFDVDGLVMVIGADEAGRLLEIGLATAEGIDFIVHAMPARPRFLR